MIRSYGPNDRAHLGRLVLVGLVLVALVALVVCAILFWPDYPYTQ